MALDLKELRNKKFNLNISKYLVYKIISALFFSTPVIVLFWQQNGLNFTQIMVLQSLYAATIIFLEIPTGAIADFVGRKFSITTGTFILALAMAIYSLGHNFSHFLIAEIVFGIGGCFVSGADSAFLYDTLLEQKRENLYKKIFGNIFAWYLIISALGAILGGIIGKYSLRLTLALQVPVFLIAGTVALTFIEPKIKKQLYERGYWYHIYKSVRFALIKNAEIRWLTFYSGIISTIGLIGFFFYQPYMKLSGLDIFYFGIAFALYNIIAALSSKFAHKIEEKIGKRMSLILPTIFLIIGLYLMGSIIWVYGFVFGFLLQFVRGFSGPVIEDYINKIVWSDKRATIMSFSNLLGRLFFIIISPLIGYFADVFSLQQALLLSGTIALIICAILLLLMNKDRVFKEVK